MDILKSILIWLIGIAFILVFFPVTFLIWLIVLPLFGGFHEITIRIFDPVFPGYFGTDDCDLLALKFHDMLADELVRLRADKPRK